MFFMKLCLILCIWTVYSSPNLLIGKNRIEGDYYATSSDEYDSVQFACG
jgi:hypothetical protein